MTASRILGVVALMAALSTLPRAAAGQSIVTSELRGMVVDSAARPLAGTLVTLRTMAGGSERIVTVERDGRFAFSFIPPGNYQLQAEALGWRPVLVDPLRMEAGRTATLRLVLARSAPPVDRRDTVPQASAPEGIGGTMSWLDGATLGRLPAGEPELDPILSASGVTDPTGGLEGLPERLTTAFVDGQPFHPARHPSSASDPSGGLLVPRSALNRVDLPGASDVEWTLAGAGAVALSTGVERPTPEAFGLWGGNSGWRGAILPDKPPAFDSWWGGGATTLNLVGDTARLHVAVESGSWAHPLAPIGDSVAKLLGDPAAELSRPALSESTWTTGSMRLEWSLPDGGALQAGVDGANFSRAAPGRPVDLGYAAQPGPVEGTDVLANASLARQLTGPVSLEVRAGGSFSRRRFGATDAGAAPATLVIDPALSLGGAAQEQGEVTRTDFGGTVGVHYTQGPHEVKGGVRGSFTNHSYDLLAQPRPVFLFGSATQVGRSGVFTERTGSLAPVSFSLPAVDVFGQYRWAARPGLTLTAGGRFGMTVYPVADIKADPRWFLLTGLINKQIPANAKYVGGIAHGSWDLAGDNRTLLEGGLTIEEGEADPAALYEVIANSGQINTLRASGDLSQWPVAPTTNPAARTASLTLLDPEFGPPRTSRGLVGLAHRFPGGTTLRVQATARRTELLLRRSDLNQPLQPFLTGEGGRPVQSTVQLSGGVLAAPASGWRRFSEYDAVWALNSDGWSEYRGVTLSFDRALGRVGTIFAAYTYSETTDNMVGLAAGDPWALVSPGIPSASSSSWEEGTSDLDIPHRGAAGVVLPMPGGVSGYVSALYRGRSGTPFTPMVRAGLDVNGDGSWSNDPAWIPNDANAVSVATDAGCSRVSPGSFPERNSCRGAAVHELDLRLALGPLMVGRTGIQVTLDLTNATDQADGTIDDALLMLQPNSPLSTSGGKLTVPYRVNPDFGSLRARADRGRQLRVGIRLGPPR